MKNTKTNANPKINILMSENIGQRRLKFINLAFFVQYFQT